MQTRNLTIEEIREVYEKYICYDFPFDERKPLSRIEQSIREGRYLCVGAFAEDGGFLAYAFFVFEKDACLLDYYAVVPEMRGKGIGSAFLRRAVEQCSSEVTIIEIDDPESEVPEEEKRSRGRRLDFYMKAGAINTNVHVLVFGVEYLLLEYPLKKTHDEDTIADGYCAIYRSILPKKMYEQNISVRRK